MGLRLVFACKRDVTHRLICVKLRVLERPWRAPTFLQKTVSASLSSSNKSSALPYMYALSARDLDAKKKSYYYS